MFGGITFAGALFGGVVGIVGPLPAVPTDPGIIIGGIDVTARVRVQGVTIRDILNDAPNTATLTIEGDAPAVGQPVTITIGPRLLFAGAIQTIDQAYESLPTHVAWHLTAIDDTGRANMRRPFGSFVDTSASTIAQTITTTFAPGFATTGIAAGLPNVTITFDGADTFIACLARLATAVGGYCKIEDRRVYLFLVDPADPPNPIDAAHRFLTNPPITLTTDVSQLRTRVYGKGYGENVPTDVGANETLIPIQDGALFPPLGGTAIVGFTADGAQSDRIAFTGVSRPVGGTLVGSGAAPANAPTLGLATGGVVTNGVHQVAVVHVTAVGKSLAGPAGSINVNPIPAPATAPTTSPATNGTGPDQGSHDYATTFLMLGGETTPGPASNAVTTSAATGQLPSPGTCGALTLLSGAGLPDGIADYVATFVNAIGETPAGPYSGFNVTAGPVRVGQTTPVTPGGVVNGTGSGLSGGSIEDQHTYSYYGTFTTAGGETVPGGWSFTVPMLVGQHSTNVSLQVSPDPRVTGRKIYRLQDSGSSAQSHLCATISNNTATTHLDTVSHASIAAQPPPPTVDSTANPGTLQPYNRVQVTGIPTGPAGTTSRKLYRAFNLATTYGLVGTIGDNTTTTYTDGAASVGAAPPTSNTTGTAVQKVPVSAIPLGPPGVTGRNLYRRFNGSGPYKLVTTIANNTTATYSDTTPNSGLGVSAPATNTATGNTINVTAIPTGASAVTARELYMTLAGATALHLVQTIADNTTTTATINLADASLTGAAPPATDTSGLQQPQGQVPAGSTTLIVASPAPFAPSGGWVTTGGGQVIRYTGISGQLLTGVPATGPGAIVTTVLYGQQATPTPTLTGVTGLTKVMLKGSAVHIWVQRDDTLAQSEHAARTGTDGVVEFLIVDSRRGVPSLTARCDADLKLFARPILTVQYATRDMKTASGKTVTINLTSPPINATMIIQEVTITEIGIAPNLAPRFTVKASTVRFSLEDTLRRLIAGGLTDVNS